MSDGTRTPSGSVEELDAPRQAAWVRLTGRVDQLRSEGRALLTLVARWSDSTHDLIRAAEAEISSSTLSDEAFAEVGRFLGLNDLQLLADEIAASCEPNTAPR